MLGVCASPDNLDDYRNQRREVNSMEQDWEDENGFERFGFFGCLFAVIVITAWVIYKMLGGQRSRKRR